MASLCRPAGLVSSLASTRAPCRRALTAIPRPAGRVVVTRALTPAKQVNGAVHDGLFNEQFASILAAALARNPSEAAHLNAAAMSLDEVDDIDHSRATMEVLQTALVTSRQTLTRLVGLQATLEAEISTQQKQLERLQFLMNKTKGDYAYLATVEKLRQKEKAAAAAAAAVAAAAASRTPRPQKTGPRRKAKV